MIRSRTEEGHRRLVSVSQELGAREPQVPGVPSERTGSIEAQGKEGLQ